MVESTHSQKAVRMTAKRHYRSYLLRLWSVGPEPCDWRAMLENPSTGERQGFANLDALCEWLHAQAVEPERSRAPLVNKEVE
jgi:hypothetical protein